MAPQEVEIRAANAMRMYQIHVARGMQPEEAAGWAANAEAESRGDHRARQPGGPGRGLFQWGSDIVRFDRRRDFERLFGHPIENSTEAEQLAFRDWSSPTQRLPPQERLRKRRMRAILLQQLRFITNALTIKCDELRIAPILPKPFSVE
jgi:hypothetical protein